jgi:hypothetical protein
VALSRAAASGDGEDHGDVRRVDLLPARNADRPSEPARAQGLTKGCTEAVAGIGEDAAKAGSGGAHTIDLLQRDLRLATISAVLLGHAGAVQSRGIGGIRPVSAAWTNSDSIMDTD